MTIGSLAPLPGAHAPRRPAASATAAPAPDPAARGEPASRLPTTSRRPGRPRPPRHPGESGVIEVVADDDPWTLAETHLGDGARWRELWDANRDRVQPDGQRWTVGHHIEPGWTLVLPSAPPPRAGHRRRGRDHRGRRRHRLGPRRHPPRRPGPLARTVRRQPRPPPARRQRLDRSRPAAGRLAAHASRQQRQRRNRPRRATSSAAPDPALGTVRRTQPSPATPRRPAAKRTRTPGDRSRRPGSRRPSGRSRPIPTNRPSRPPPDATDPSDAAARHREHRRARRRPARRTRRVVATGPAEPRCEPIADTGRHDDDGGVAARRPRRDRSRRRPRHVPPMPAPDGAADDERPPTHAREHPPRPLLGVAGSVLAVALLAGVAPSPHRPGRDPADDRGPTAATRVESPGRAGDPRRRRGRLPTASTLALANLAAGVRPRSGQPVRAAPSRTGQRRAHRGPLDRAEPAAPSPWRPEGSGLVWVLDAADEADLARPTTSRPRCPRW